MKVRVPDRPVLDSCPCSALALVDFAIQVMRKGSTALLLFIAAGCLAAAPPQTPQAGFDGARAYEDLRQVVAIGPRPAGSAGAESTRTYIRQQLAAVGLKAQDQSFVAQTPLGPVKMTNLRVTIPGTGSGRLVIGGHYDTKLFRDFSFVGANDGGSSTAFLIELGRVLKARKNAVHDRVAVPRRRGINRRVAGRPTTPTAAATTSRRRGRTARSRRSGPSSWST